ncbi:MAG: 50S ribosomal protein L11 methyltransferase [Clostridiales bacterium]|jgi:ribosomal protein L11 methyltransferase|nr:50S ribosomal protein L11 methyltransferase [Clostridiales bacterium]
MEWIEAKVYTTSEGIEPITGLLLDCGILGTQVQDELELMQFLRDNPLQWDYIDEELEAKAVEPVSILFYASHNESGLSILARALERLKWLKEDSAAHGFDFGSLEVELSKKDDEIWLNAWKEHYKPFKVGSIVIRPEWEPYEKNGREKVLTINPGHVFGTGLHQSTQLCIEQLEKYVFSGARVMDLGCGSGILSIISMLLGAGDVMACDLDPNAYEIACANARLNGFSESSFKVLSGNALSDDGLRRKLCAWGKADVIAANITADVIIGLSGLAASCSAEGSVLIASGIISQRLEETLSSLSQSFNLLGAYSKDGWHCLVMRHA